MLNQIKVYFQCLWAKWFPKPESLPPPAAKVIAPTPDTCVDTALEECEVTAIESDVVIPSIPIDLEFLEPPAAKVVEEPQPSALSHTMDQFLALLMARELRAHKHHSATGSCNADVPRVDSRVDGPPQDCRVNRPTNSRVPHN
jgi:hypothetical protein